MFRATIGCLALVITFLVVTALIAGAEFWANWLVGVIK